MAREQALQELQALFETTCMDLFEGLNCVVTRVSAPDFDMNEVPTACIDAGAGQLEVFVIMRLPLTVLALTYPDHEELITSVDEEKLEDWISELCNQLIGRFKNRLIPFGCVMLLGLPSSYFGTDINELLPVGYEHFVFHFEADGEVFECRISINLIDENLSLDSPEEDDGAGEGELELF